MSLKLQRSYNILLLVLSWLSLTLIDSRNIKRFFPATLTIGIIEILNAWIGKKRKWWVFYNKPNSYWFGELPFNAGPFVFISLWTLKLAYGNFKKYLLINAMIHAFFAFPFSFFAKKIKYYSLVRFNYFQFFIYFFLKAPLLYFLQFYFENKNQFKLFKQR
ncbi:hypothetical protein C2I17_01920 [Niallia circulans]|jgi:hypothetical protein|uniref:Uncharacterized protein n=1 Tax=Niallia circulans TaxID=1397 RepID=A0AA91TUG7_NIACI|nr:hypothetical protein [Niallia circulans]PAD84360.1 hypothetical protein CHH57_05585 [Niallia circulans]UQZ73413.1 hypothetical protein C2I17_01920 [Niallia circulans]